MNGREERGLIIAALCKLNKKPDGEWLVPSQSQGETIYQVNPTAKTCTCFDHQERGENPDANYVWLTSEMPQIVCGSMKSRTPEFSRVASRFFSSSVRGNLKAAIVTVPSKLLPEKVGS